MYLEGLATISVTGVMYTSAGGAITVCASCQMSTLDTVREWSVELLRLPSTGAYQTADVPIPATVKYYNQFMGGVDNSDQLKSYYKILCQTKKYWKTLFIPF